MKYSFATRQEAEAYKEKHQLRNMVVEHIEYMDKWAIVYPIKSYLEVLNHSH
jgi:hypothetical protein